MNRPLLVMMHGWSCETHLFRLVSHLPRDVVVAARARIPEAGGYAWFPIRDPPVRGERGHTGVMTWLDTLDVASSIALLGFCQGGAMVLQSMRHAAERFAYGVNLAGVVVDDTQPGDEKLTGLRPPLFWWPG